MGNTISSIKSVVVTSIKGVFSRYVEFSEKYTTYFSSYNDVQFSAAFCKDNIMGCQFHPEKSHRFGMEYFKTILSDNYE